MMAKETKVKLEGTKARPDANLDMGRTGRGNNQDQNQQLIKNIDKCFEKAMETVVRRNEAIRVHIFESTLFVQSDQYWKTLKEIAEYSGMNFKFNVRKSIEMLKYQCLTCPTLQ